MNKAHRLWERCRRAAYPFCICCGVLEACQCCPGFSRGGVLPLCHAADEFSEVLTTWLRTVQQGLLIHWCEPLHAGLIRRIIPSSMIAGVDHQTMQCCAILSFALRHAGMDEAPGLLVQACRLSCQEGSCDVFQCNRHSDPRALAGLITLQGRVG